MPTKTSWDKRLKGLLKDELGAGWGIGEQSGRTKITYRYAEGNEQLVGENQSTYIPMGCKHRLSNPGRIPVELIEVQSGEYLGEDDIVRFQDCYGRSDLSSRDLSMNAS